MGDAKFIRLNPSINSDCVKKTFQFSMTFTVKQFNGLYSTDVKINDETRTFYAEKTQNITSRTTNGGNFSGNIYMSNTTRTKAIEYFTYTLTKDDITFFTKLESCKTARIRFNGIGSETFDIGEFEKESILKMINYMEKLYSNGYRLLQA